jgi:hypothetical protein
MGKMESPKAIPQGEGERERIESKAFPAFILFWQLGCYGWLVEFTSVMAEYLTRSSSGKNDNTASMSVLLPAALALWMMMASGLSNLRDTPAR